MKHLASFAPKPRQRGIAFIVVLWVIAMLAIMLGGFSLITRTENLQARHLFDSTQARYAAEAGLNLAVFELRKTDPVERWIGDGRPYTFHYGDAEIEVRITDDSGKFDLNSVCNSNGASMMAQPPAAGVAASGMGILVNLFASHGMPFDQAEALGVAVADFCDPDDLTQPNGAEAPEYEAAGLSYQPKNAPFDTVSELQQVLGMTHSLFSQIEPSLTIYSGRPSPTAAYADEQMLAAMYPDAAPEELAALVQQRQSMSQADMMAAGGLTLPDGTSLMAGGGGLTYSVKSRAKLPNGASTTLDATIRMGGVSASGRPYVILRWRDGEAA